MNRPVATPLNRSLKVPPKQSFQLFDQTPSGGASSPARGKPKKKVAHFQYVTAKENLCNSIMVLAELDKAGTVADKVLLYPASWVGDESGTWSRLLKAAASRYSIKVRAVGSFIERISMSPFASVRRLS
jgi:hypothetical protein